jgi:hypothetical protein
MNGSPATATPLSNAARQETFLAVRNALKLGASLICTWGTALAVKLLVPCYLGPDTFGALTFADAFTATFFVALTLGVDLYTRKEVSVRLGHAADFFGGIVAVRVAISAALFCAMAVVMHATQRPPEVRMLVYLFAAALLDRGWRLTVISDAGELLPQFRLVAGRGVGHPLEIAIDARAESVVAVDELQADARFRPGRVLRPVLREVDDLGADRHGVLICRDEQLHPHHRADVESLVAAHERSARAQVDGLGGEAFPARLDGDGDASRVAGGGAVGRVRRRFPPEGARDELADALAHAADGVEEVHPEPGVVAGRRAHLADRSGRRARVGKVEPERDDLPRRRPALARDQQRRCGHLARSGLSDAPESGKANWNDECHGAPLGSDIGNRTAGVRFKDSASYLVCPGPFSQRRGGAFQSRSPRVNSTSAAVGNAICPRGALCQLQ